MPVDLTSDSQPLTQSSFERIKNREFVPERSLFGLKYLRDKARSERDLRDLYRNRAPYELLQNADDAGASVAVFSLAPDGMAFSHNGRWFTVGNFRSLADGWSDKDPNECIGHKGLGFRSVLDITPSPHLVRIDGSFLAVKFGWAQNNNHIQQTLAASGELKQHYASWTQGGQRTCPVMAIPALARKEGLGGGLTILNRFLAGSELTLTTMFWLPATDPELPKQIAEDLSTEPFASSIKARKRLEDFLINEVDVVLPFLESVREILVMDGTVLIGRTKLDLVSEVGSERIIRVSSQTSTKHITRDFFQFGQRCTIPPNIRNASGTPKAVKYMKEADLKLAVRLQDGEPVPDQDARFHVYFPTEQFTGFGFLVHGDFHVQPDRKYLVPGTYNDWLFSQAAKLSAGDCMSSLLRDHVAGNVFSTLAPLNQNPSRDNYFRDAFCTALKNRKIPFIPCRKGNVLPTEAMFSPSPNCALFWERSFSSVISAIHGAPKCFVASEHDGPGCRAFLRFVGVEVAKYELLISLIEAAGSTEVSVQPAQWWYECYRQLANDEHITVLGRSSFVGRKLIPGSSDTILRVQSDDGLLVCLHPDTLDKSQTVPALFGRAVAFVNGELCSLLETGPDEIASWILNRFHISRFEASDLIPRTIRAIAPKLFAGELATDSSALVEAWRFIRTLIARSKVSFSDDFWSTIGRLPVVSTSAQLNGTIEPSDLIPCSAAYWPDELLEAHASISGVRSFRRISADFLSELPELRQDADGWRQFLMRAGVESRPKLLTYARAAVSTEDVFIRKDSASTFQGFNGERQHDANVLIAEELTRSELWDEFINAIPECGHAVPRVLQALSLIDGLGNCCEVAAKEFCANNPAWEFRLKDLVSSIPVNAESQSSGAVFCRGGRQGGHTIGIPNFVFRQLAELQWLPSTAGPAGINQCFLRRPAYKLISDTRSGENINDWLLPSVVVEDAASFLRLSKLGVAELEGPAARTDSLVRALKGIGDRLSRSDDMAWVVQSPARWRAIRGAVQNIYRTLNQREDIGPEIRSVRFASGGRDQISFRPIPLYYAEPGPIRDAFSGQLPLIDADRIFAALLDAIGIVQLVPGSTVHERVEYDGDVNQNYSLHSDIVEGIGPYLIALGRARSDSASDSDLSRRRLAERFSVLSVSNLRVRFSLDADGNSQSVSSPPLPFYLQRRVLERKGAISEAHYTLFANSIPNASLFDVDADALGSALVPMFQDRPSSDAAALFARICVRYKDLHGNQGTMKDFMYTQLGVSFEIMESVEDEEASGLDPVVPDLPAPPPSIIVEAIDSQDGPNLEQAIQDKENELKSRAVQLVGKFVHASQRTQNSRSGTEPNSIEPITPKQQARGLNGEREIERRLRLANGWDGFHFLRDTRTDNCGYDYEAYYYERVVRIEVKTFSGDGRVIVTSRELQTAAEYRKDYFLVGIRDSEEIPPYQWSTFIMQDPAVSLMTFGEFIVDAKLEVEARVLFGF